MNVSMRLVSTCIFGFSSLCFIETTTILCIDEISSLRNGELKKLTKVKIMNILMSLVIFWTLFINDIVVLRCGNNVAANISLKISKFNA